MQLTFSIQEGLNGTRNESQTSTFIDNLSLPVHGWFRYSAGFSALWVRELIRRRAPGCPMARWRLECNIVVANEPVGCVLLWLRQSKRKSWFKPTKWEISELLH